MKPKPCNGYFVQPAWPPEFGGTSPIRCRGFETGPHVWIEGGELYDGSYAMYECKVCGRGGDDCPLCEESEDANVDCSVCCGNNSAERNGGGGSMPEKEGSFSKKRGGNDGA